MVLKITVPESSSYAWKWTLYLSVLFAIIGLVIFYQLNNIVAANYVRLIAFIFFAVAVFASLKLMEGRRNIELEADDRKLIVAIKKKGAVIKETDYNLSKIDFIQPIPAMITLPVSDVTIPLRSSFTYKIKLTTEEKSFYLFHFGGAVLSIHKNHQKTLYQFFDKLSLTPSNSNNGESDETK